MFVTSGPSKHDVNGTKYGHKLDGLGRYSTVNFHDGRAVFKSKMLRGHTYNRTIELGTVPPGILFTET